MKYRLLLLLGIFILAAGAVGFFTIHAQNVNKGLIVYPVNFDFTYSNEPTTGKINLLNNNEQPVTIRVDLRNFTASGEEGGVNLTGDNTSYSLASWITVNPTTITIPAHASQVFNFTVIPSKNAEPGGHFGSIVFATVPNAQIKGTAGAAISQEVASLVLYRIPGNAQEKAYLESFVPDKQFYELGPVAFIARVKNVGQVHIAPIGQIIVKGTFGDKYIVNVDPRNVLPNAIRKIPSILNNKLLIGKYSAILIAAYGSKNEQLNGYTEFYAFPIRYAAVIVVILLVLFFLRKRLGKAIKTLVTGK